jgi:excisionase family DNA binding protein
VLNVSRPHVVKLAREGILPHRMVGNRHRFLGSDVRVSRQHEAARRSEVLAGLAPEGGYTAGDF